MSAPTDTPSVTLPLQGIHHVRVTVTDIARSKAFYSAVLDREPAIDFSDETDPEAATDPARFFAGCAYSVEGNIVGLRPSAATGDRFDSTRVGLDHLALSVPARTDLEKAAAWLDANGVENGGVTSLTGMGMSILSFQDPDDINLELVAPEE